MKNKHLTYLNRIDLERKLTLGESFRCIATELEKSPTTISNEVKKRSLCKQAKPYGRPPNSCIHRHSCEKQGVCFICQYKKPKKYCRLCKHCNQNCSDYKEDKCQKLLLPPYVCNPCPQRNSCSLTQNIYEAKTAHLQYESSWKEDREGFYLTGLEMEHVDKLISPRIKQGQSPYVVLCAVKDQLPCGLSTVYRLINEGELLVRNADLPRKMRHRPPKVKRMHKVDKKCREARTYGDFLRFVEETKPPFIVEMDTLEGKKGGPVALSLEWKQFALHRLHWRERNDAHSVKQWINHYEEMLGIELFKELFPIILTDRGTEFTNPESVEFSPVTGERRTYVFYCDPQRSDQKGAIERNHSELRRVIPKGADLNKWPQALLSKVCDHLNSYPRKILKDKSPYDTFYFFMGYDIPAKLGWNSIPAEDIYLKESFFQINQ